MTKMIKRDHLSDLKVYLLITVINFIIFWNSLSCGFVFDDVSAIKDNRDLRPNTPLQNIVLNDFWGTPMSKEQSHKSYRPVCVFTFRLNYLVHELNPFGYHLVNLVLHIIVCVLYFKTCLSITSKSVSAIASLLFAVHPVHTEAVTGVVGRAELLSSVFFLLALKKYLENAKSSSLATIILFMVFTTLAMFSKEQGITVLGVAFVLELVMIQKLKLTSKDSFFTFCSNLVNNWSFVCRTTLLFVTGLALLLIRFKVMGSTLPVFTNFDNPASYENFPTKQLTYAYLITLNVWLLLNPSDLCCDWTMGTVALVRKLSDFRNLATLATFSSIVMLGSFGLTSHNKRYRQTVLCGLAISILSFLPASNLFFPVGFVIAERVLYIPSMGFCLLAAFGIRNLVSKSSLSNNKYSGYILVSVVLISHGFKTALRNCDWYDELSLFTSGLKVNRGNAKLFNNVGHALEAKEKFSEALKYFEQAVTVQPDDIGAHINVGRTYNNLKLYKKAEQAYLKAKSLLPQARPGQNYTVRIAPQYLNVFLNLGNLISKDPTRLEEADALYRQAISMRRDYIQAYINRGDILIKLNRTNEAQEVYERALTIDNTNPDLYYNLGVVLLEQGKTRLALAYFDKALEIEPNHVQSLINSAILIQEMSSVELRPVAYERLYHLMSLEPNNERIYFNLGILAMDDQDIQSAEKWFRKAIALKPDFRSALFNLSLLLNDQKRSLEAIPFLKMVMKYHPDHIKGLILLGDIYANHVRDFREAEMCYKKILEIDPVNIQAHHNLCVLMVERGEVEAAQDCLLKVQKMAPDLEYIKRHIEIVQNRIKDKKTRESMP